MITLWGRNNSTNVKKVLWTLEELGIPYNQILAGLEHGLNHDAEYLAMNPNGLVPLLRDDKTDLILWESNTIVRYLLAEYGQDSLWIADPARRAQGEKWMDWANGSLSPAHRGILMGLVRTPPEKRDMAAIAASKKACDEQFAILDSALAQSPWLSGDAFGAGDIAVAPFVYNLFNATDGWTPRPHLQAWYQKLTERPAYRKAVMIPVT